MRKKRSSRIISLLLTIVMLLSTISPTFTFADDDSGIGGGGTGGGSSGGQFSGTMSSNQEGYRLYLVNADGKRVSNKVDLRTKAIPSNTVKTWNDRVSNESLYNKEDSGYNSVVVGYFKDLAGVKQDVPKPMIYQGKFKGNGENFKQWMLANADAIGSTISYAPIAVVRPTGGTPNPKPDPIPTQGEDEKKAEVLPGISVRCWDLMQEISKAKRQAMAVAYSRASDWTGVEAYTYVDSVMKQTYNEIVVNAGIPINGGLSSKELAFLKDALAEQIDMMDREFAWNRFKKEGQSDTYNNAQDEKFYEQQNSNNDSGRGGKFSLYSNSFFNSLFTLANAAETGGTSPSQTAIEDANIYYLLNSNNLFDLNVLEANGVNLKYDKDLDGVRETPYEKMTDIIVYEDLYLFVEALYWWKPAQSVQQSDGSWAGGNEYSKYFYGTLNGYARWVATNSDGWKDGGKGGWYGNTMNITGAAALHIPEDFETSTGAFKIKGVSVPTSKLSTSTFADGTLGYNLHIYWGNPNKGSGTHTYDWHTYPYSEEPTENKYIPNPAPDPKTDVEHTAVYVTEHPEEAHYRIVKSYEKEVMDPSGNITIEHVETHVREQTIPTITIENETPNYELIEWKTGENYIPVDITTAWTDPEIDGIPAIKSGVEEGTVEIADPADPAKEITLYVRLRQKLKLPEIDTGYPDNPVPHPAPDPDTIPLEPGEDPDITRRVTIIKHYEEIDVALDGTQTVTNIGPYIRENTPFIINIIDEPEFKVKNWFISTSTYNGDPSDGDGSTYDDSLSKFTSSRSGTSTQQVRLDMIENILVVKLVKYKYATPLTGDIFVTQSQISKAIETIDGAHIPGWGIQPATWPVSAISCLSGHSGSHGLYTHNYNCWFSSWVDQSYDFWLDNKRDAVNKLQYETLTGPFRWEYEQGEDGAHPPKGDRTNHNYDVKNIAGDNMKQILWRGEDVPTLAKYKSNDTTILELLGSQSNDIIPKHNRISNINAKNYNIFVELGQADKSNVDTSGQMDGCSCAGDCGVVTKYYGLLETLKYPANVAVEMYSGANTPTGLVTRTGTLPLVTKYAGLSSPINAARFNGGQMIQQSEHIKFYPYINMTFQKTGDVDNAAYSGRPTSPVTSERTDVSVLSQYDFDIIPNTYVEASWTTNDYDFNLTVRSPQWSTHQRATTGSEEWKGYDQVLPGGALYTLDTEDADTYMNIVTWQTILDDNTLRNILPNAVNGGKYTTDNAFKQHENLANQVIDSIQNWRVVQFIETDYTKDNALDGLNVTEDGNGGVSLNSLTGYSGKKTSTDSKYLLLSKELNPDTSYKGGANCGNIDTPQIIPKIDYYKLQSDISGNVKLLKLVLNANITRNGSHLEVTPVDPSTLNWAGATVIEEITKDQTAFTSQAAKELDERTKILTNYLTAITRNKGNDPSSDWVTDGKWYNEAIDGIYVMRYETQMKIGFYQPNKRATVLDPNLCPGVTNKADNYSTAVMSQFAVNNKSDLHPSENDGYLGTFESATNPGVKTKVYLPNFQEMFKSNIFYIPNANVQDLNQ